MFSDNYARIKIGSYDYFLLEKTLTLHNFVIVINSVFDKNQNNCHQNTFLEYAPVNS